MNKSYLSFPCGPMLTDLFFMVKPIQEPPQEAIRRRQRHQLQKFEHHRVQGALLKWQDPSCWTAAK